MAETKTTSKALKYETLYAALAAFQADLPRVTKSAEADAGKYKYSYTPLEKLVEAVFPKLAAVGIAFTAVPHLREADGAFVLRAKLVHESGETISGDYPLGNAGAPAQAIGSVVSYARRYALLSLTGVAPEGEDDDGSKGAEAAGTTAPPSRASKPKSAAASTVDSVRAEISALLADDSNNLTGEDANALLSEASGSAEPKSWQLKHYQAALEGLKAKIAQN